MLAVAAIVDIRESFSVILDRQRRVCKVFHGSNGNIAFIGGRACNLCIVGILGKHKAVAGDIAGVMRHRILVACGDADDDAGLVKLIVYIAENIFFQFGIIDEAAGRTDRHVDCINAETIAVFQSCHIDAGVCAGRLVSEDLHEHKLCIRSSTREGNCAVRIKNEARDCTGNVGAVSVVVGYVVVHIIIVVRERNLLGNVLAVDNRFDRRDIFLGECRGSQKTVILESFMVEIQTRIQNSNDHSFTLIADVLHRCCAGDQVCVHLFGFFVIGSVIFVCNVNVLNAVHLFHCKKVLIRRTEGHTVDQSGVVIHALSFKR